MNDDVTMEKIISMLSKYSRSLQYIDLSNTSLAPKLLIKLFEELIENPYNVRSINISYNILGKNEAIDETFVGKIISYLKLTDMLNHLDISGMNFKDYQLKDLCEHICCCPNLLAVHLNDNGISRD